MADTSPNTPLQAATRRCRPALIAAAGFSGVLNVLTLSLPLHSMQVMDRVLSSRSCDTLIFLTLAALGAVLLASVLEAVRGRLLARAAEWLEASLSGPACSRMIESALDGRAEAADPLRDLSTLRSALCRAGDAGAVRRAVDSGLPDRHHPAAPSDGCAGAGHRRAAAGAGPDRRPGIEALAGNCRHGHAHDAAHGGCRRPLRAVDRRHGAAPPDRAEVAPDAGDGAGCAARSW